MSVYDGAAVMQPDSVNVRAYVLQSPLALNTHMLNQCIVSPVNLHILTRRIYYLIIPKTSKVQDMFRFEYNVMKFECICWTRWVEWRTWTFGEWQSILYIVYKVYCVIRSCKTSLEIVQYLASKFQERGRERFQVDKMIDTKETRQINDNEFNELRDMWENELT